MDFQFEGLTIAVTNMRPMLQFYSRVFGIEFKEQELFGATLYAGEWGELQLLFCPAAIAQNTAQQNRHQFDLLVADLDQLIETAIAAGGQLMGPVTEDEHAKSVGIYDPDRNSMVFKQLTR